MTGTYRDKPFGDLTPQEKADWMIADPDGYFAASQVDARELVERELDARIRRRRAQQKERAAQPFRRLWARLRRRRGTEP